MAVVLLWVVPAMGQSDAAPEITGDLAFEVDEGETSITTLTATDDDTAPADLVWSLAGEVDNAGEDTDLFTLSESGELAFGSAKDFEVPDDVGADRTYELTVQVSDGLNDVTADLVVTLDNVIELVAIEGPSVVSFAENSWSRVATFTASSPQDRDGISWTLGGSDAAYFSIDEPSGALRFDLDAVAPVIVKKPPDFEAPVDSGTDNAYAVTLLPSSGLATAVTALSVTVTVTDADELGAVSLSTKRPRTGVEVTATLEDPDGVGAGSATWAWERSAGSNEWAAIAGADSSSYTPVAADAGSFLRASASYSDNHGSGAAHATAPEVVAADQLSDLSIRTNNSYNSSNAWRKMRPAFAAETLHYSVGCNNNDTMTLTMSAADAASRISVDGIQFANPGAGASLTATQPVTGNSVVRIALTDAEGAQTQYVVHCLPNSFTRVEVEKPLGEAKVLDELIIYAGNQRLVVIDSNGVPRRHAPGPSSSFARFYPDVNGEPRYSHRGPGGYTILDADWEKVDTASSVAPLTRTDSHDFRVLDNGNYMVMAYQDTERDLSHLTFTDENDQPYGTDVYVEDSAIQIVTPGEQAVFNWNSWDHMPLEDCAQHFFPPGDGDYAHLNALQMSGGHIIASMRGCSRVLAIDADSGDVVWRVGPSNLSDAEWAERDIGPAPLDIVGDPEKQFCGQHGSSQLPNGNLILYDNGVQCTRNPWTLQNLLRTNGEYSRALEYAIDVDNGEAVFVRDHSLHGTKSELGYRTGNVEVVGNGHWLVSWGGRRPRDPSAPPSPSDVFTQVDPDTGEEWLSVDGPRDTTRGTLMAPEFLAEAPEPLGARILAGSHTSMFHSGVGDDPTVAVAFNRPVADFGVSSPSLGVVGASVSAVAPLLVAGEPANAYLVTLAPEGAGAITVSWVAGKGCDVGGVCAADGTELAVVPSALVVDPPIEVSFGAAVYSVSEGTTLQVPVELSEAHGHADIVEVPIVVSGGTASADDFSVAAVVSFAAGETTKTVAFDAVDDALVEGPETVELGLGELEAGFSEGATTSTTVTIADTDAAVLDFTVESGEVSEGGETELRFAITNGVTFADDQVIDIAVSGSATAGDDFVLEDSVGRTLVAPYEVTLAAGASSVAATLGAVEDDVEELAETVTLSAVLKSTGTAIGSRTVTIPASDLDAPEVTIAAGAAVTEGSDAVFTLSRTAPLGSPLEESLTVRVAVTATGGVLGVASPSTVTFAAGDDTVVLNLATVVDAVVEPAATVAVRVLSSSAVPPTYEPGASNSATVTVRDDDFASFSVTASATRVVEGGTATVTVDAGGVSFAQLQTLTVTVTGSADVDDDFVLADEQGQQLESPYGLVLAAGAGAAVLELRAVIDDVDDDAESVILSFSHDGQSVGTVLVTLADANRAPSVSGPNRFWFAENGTATVAVFTATDPEADEITWGLAGGDASLFNISAGELSFDAAPDFEDPADTDSDNVYEVTVRASDPEDAADYRVTVTVTDVDEATIITSGSGFLVFEHAENSAVEVARFVAADPEDAPIRWSLGGADSAVFVISDLGVLDFVRPPDFEHPGDQDTDNTYVAQVQARAGASDPVTAAVTVTVINVDERGAVVLSSPQSQVGTRLTGAVADPDGIGGVLSWTWQRSLDGSGWDDILGAASVGYTPTAGDVGYFLAVEAEYLDGFGSGIVTARAQAVLRTRAAPGVPNSAPGFGVGSVVRAVAENSTEGAAVGAPVVADDPDSDDRSKLAYTVSGADAGLFTVDASTGQIRVGPRAVPDFEAAVGPYSVTVTATDPSGDSGSVAVTIEVAGVNEAPVAAPDTAVTSEDASVAVSVLANDTDPDADALTVAVRDAPLFGSVRAQADNTLLYTPRNDFNGKDVFSYAASDGRLTGETTVTVTVSPVNDQPKFSSSATVQRFVADGAPAGTPVGAPVTAGDADGEPLRYGLFETDDQLFAIGADTGQIRVAEGTVIDRSVQSSYRMRVEATDPHGARVRTLVNVNVTVAAKSEGPTVSGPQSLSFAENQATERVLGSYGAVDPQDPSALITRWSLSGTDAGDFSVSDSGELSFRKVPDFERPADSNKDNVYSLSVRASDGRNYGYLGVTVTVSDVNEAPDITTGKTAFAYRENSTSALATFRAADPEGAAVAWSLSGTDSDDFAISETGVMSFAAVPDFDDPADADRDNVYEVTVEAHDGQGNVGSLAVAVTATDVNEGPTVSGPQSLSFAENQATDRVLGSYGAVDPEDPSGLITRWSLSGTDAGDFSVSDSGELSFRRVPDFERPADSNKDNVYSLSVRASDGRHYGYLAVTVTVSDVNEAPDITTSKTEFAYRENSTSALATFRAADPEGAAVAWSLSGTDGEHFAIHQGTLTFKRLQDFDEPADADPDNVYEVTVVAADDEGLAAVLAVTVTVTDVNEGPTVTGPRSLSFAENQTTEQVLGSYGATDPEDPSATITRWSLSGTDAGDFTVSDTGELSFRKVPDFERPADSNKDNAYSLSVRASDGRHYGYHAVTVTVSDVNEAPEITTSKTEFAYRENATAAVATFSADDPEDAAVAWSLSGTGRDVFAVTVDSRGRGVLGFAAPPNFEDPADAGPNNVYEVTVVAADEQGLTDTLAVTVTVTDVSEGPTVTGPRSLSFAENQTTEQVLGSYGATDPEDPSATITRWSLSGTDAGDFTVSDTGELSFRKVPDFERPADSNKDNAYSLSVRASDGRHYGYHAVTVTVSDVNEAPEITTSKTEFAYRENATAAVATFSADDPEDAAVAWSLSGTGRDVFAVTVDSRGRGVLGFAAPPNFEDPADAGPNNVYEVTVVAADEQGLTDTLAVTVTVTDVSEGPTVTGPRSLSFAENQTTEQVLGSYGATDPEDPSATITRWSLSGTDAGDFTVSDTGELSFRKVPDFERPADSNKDNAYSLSVRASDGRHYGYHAVTVTVSDVNEAPEITTSKTEFAYRENATAAVATFSADDPEDAAVAWSLSGTGRDVFAVTVDSRGRGVLGFAAPPNFEDPADAGPNNVYEVTVVAADEQGLTDTLAVTVTVTDVSEGPTVTGPRSLSFAENQTTEQVLGSYGATDPEDPSATITRWSLSGTDAGDFTVSDTGELSFRKVPDFERPADSNKDNAYSLSVRASDGRHYGYHAVTVTVSDVNEAPEITTSKTEFAYRENATAAVATFSADDPEDAAVAWSLSGTGRDVFAVTVDSRGRGVLGFAAPPNFEDPADAGPNNVYEVTVVAADEQGLTDTLAVTVTVTDVSEGPTVTGPRSLSFAENQTTEQVLGSYGATDPEDPSATITRWSLSGTDAGDFTVSDTGELSFRKVPDFERPADSNKDNAYSLSVRASDGRHYGYHAVTVTVSDVNEAPEITTSKTEFAYRENATAAVATFSADDPEDAAVAWSLSGTGRDVFAVTVDSRGRGVLGFAAPPNFEDPADAGPNNVYEVTVVAADEQGLTDTLAVTVTVTDVSEGPTVTGPRSLSFAENQTTEQVLGSYGATDPEDPSATITRWSLSGTDAGDFTVSDTGELSFRKVPDFERPADSNKDNAYSLSVRASDGRHYGYHAVTVTVSDVNEAPEITTSKTEFAYRENATAAVATFSADDPEDAAVAWSLSGTGRDVFAVTVDSRGRGVLGFAAPPNFEDPADAGPNNVYEVTVVAADEQGLTDTLAVTVTVTDVSEGPTVTGPRSLSFAENQTTEQVLGSYGATDPEDPSATITRWSLSGTDAGDFTVSDTGELSFRKVPDFERPADSNKDNAYSLSVRASDGRHYGYHAVTVTVSDVNEAPEITTSKTEFAYRENATAAVATFSADDPEDAAVAWSLSGTGRDVFAVTVDSRGRGVLGFAAPPNFEDPADAGPNNVYEVTVVAADEQGLTDTLAVTVTVTDVSEGPTVTGPRSLSFAENQTTEQVLGSYGATDPEDPSATITRWSLSGTDAGDFTVSDTGELSFRKVPDFERPADSNKDNAYSLSVRASDGRHYGYHAVTVTVENVNEAPDITGSDRIVHQENGADSLATYRATDQENGTISWNLTGTDSGAFTISDAGVLAFNSPPDYEQPSDSNRNNVYEVTVEAADPETNTTLLQVTVTVTNQTD